MRKRRGGKGGGVEDRVEFVLLWAVIECIRPRSMMVGEKECSMGEKGRRGGKGRGRGKDRRYTLASRRNCSIRSSKKSGEKFFD